MSIERLSGGLTPADGSDPRTFPAIFNGFADEFEDKNLPAFSAVAPEDGQVPVFDAVEGVYEPGSVAVSDATPTVAGVVLGTTSDGANTALGDEAFQSNTTGEFNTAVGQSALRDNTAGFANVAVGVFASRENVSGQDNTAIGVNALQANIDGSSNTATGRLALRENIDGNRNTAIGRISLRNTTTANNNTAVGHEAILDATTGSNNTAVGKEAGRTTTEGVNNGSFGFNARPSSATVSNQVTLGNSSITSLRCNVTEISSLSDVRDKTDIVDTQHGLDTLNKIRPVDFTWARRDGTFGSAPDIGFIAQELASVEDETGDAHRLRLTLRDNPEKLEATPGRLIPILVKAVQELSAKNDELEARIEALEAK